MIIMHLVSGKLHRPLVLHTDPTRAKRYFVGAPEGTTQTLRPPGRVAKLEGRGTHPLDTALRAPPHPSGGHLLSPGIVLGLMKVGRHVTVHHPKRCLLVAKVRPRATRYSGPLIKGSTWSRRSLGGAGLVPLALVLVAVDLAAKSIMLRQAVPCRLLCNSLTAPVTRVPPALRWRSRLRLDTEMGKHLGELSAAPELHAVVTRTLPRW